ncbi:MAG: 5-formyltetrahydrofolate cyclo-ligase [Cyanophyceae cyanobacterium]
MTRESKTKLRQELIKQRLSLSQAEWREKSDRICYHLQTLPLFQQAQTILAYFSFRQEPDLSSLFTHKHRWGFPRCVGKSLLWHEWTVKDPLQIGEYGIQEPHPKLPSLNLTKVDLILVPAVACDYRGYRLGYGGGFYDRLLSSSKLRAATIGITFDFAYLPQLPTEPWDQKLHQVCTENGIAKRNYKTIQP